MLQKAKKQSAHLLGHTLGEEKGRETGATELHYNK